MTIKVKQPFYDDNGLHRIGDILEVDEFNDFLMEKVDQKKTEKPEPKKRSRG